MPDDQGTEGAGPTSVHGPGQVRPEFFSTDQFEAWSAARALDHLICPSCRHILSSGNIVTGSVQCEKCGHAFRLERVCQGSTIDAIRVLGRFQLLDCVGQGSFGTVWRARDTQLDRIVAVKVPHPHAIESAEDKERREREARVAAQLRHPGIVRLYEMLTVDNLPVLVSDFIEGLSLKEMLRIRRLTFREAALLVAQIADALDHAHERGLVHRDVKPANIMIEYTAGVTDLTKAAEAEPVATALGKPIVVDFGLALRPETDIVMTVEGQIVGTPAYMSPEQASGRGREVDRRSDIYNLGAVLYQLLCGELPFRGTKVMLIHQLLHEDPRPPRLINDRIPRDLEIICLKALAKLPSHRYPTAAEMAADLRRYLRGEPCRARPVGRLMRGWLWARRNPAVAAASGIATLLFIAVVIVFVVFAVREKQNTIQLQGALDQSEQHLHESKFRLAENYLDRGVGLCGRGDVAHGILLLARGIGAAPKEAVDLNRVLSSNLSAWHDTLNPLLAVRAHDLAGAEILPGHAIAFSPDGKLAATGGRTRLVRLWGGSELNALGPPIDCPAEVASLEFNGDSQSLAVACRDGKVRVLDVTRKQFSPTVFEHGARILSIAYSHDGKKLATAGMDHHVKIWNTASGRQIAPGLGEDRRIAMVAFTPDDKTILTAATNGPIRLWDSETGARRAPKGVTKQFQAAVLSPDGRWLAIANRDNSASIWDAASLSPVQLLSHPSLVWSVAFSPDSQTLLTGCSDKVARLWDVQTGRSIGPAAYHQQPVEAVAFSPDGTRILTCSEDGVCQLRR
jgi:tRNA A-37 threonylcarbamoyl transferase component Bud32